MPILRIPCVAIVLLLASGCPLGDLGAIGNPGFTCDESACGNNRVRLGGSLPVPATEDIGVIVVTLCADDFCQISSQERLSRGCADAPVPSLCDDDSLWNLTVERTDWQVAGFPWTNLSLTVRDAETSNVLLDRTFHIELSQYEVVHPSLCSAEDNLAVECQQFDATWDPP